MKLLEVAQVRGSRECAHRGAGAGVAADDRPHQPCSLRTRNGRVSEK